MSELSKALETEAIYIMREAFARFDKVGLLFSGGKDSTVMLHLALKAMYPFKKEFELVHVDTGLNFPEVNEFRQMIGEKYKVKIQIGSVEELLKTDPSWAQFTRNRLQSFALRQVLEKAEYDCLFGGGRRDEDKARAKEHLFSRRANKGGWEPYDVDPDFYPHLNTLKKKNEHFRVFPISNWTERDIWEYIKNENIELLPLYYAHNRKCLVKKDGSMLPFCDENVKQNPGCDTKELSVRFRTVGDMTNSGPIASHAKDASDIYEEVLTAKTTERGARTDDKFSAHSMEIRKKEGYF